MIIKKIVLGVILTILGVIGILSILTMEVSLPLEIETVLKNKFTAQQIKLLMLVNPTIFLLIAVTTGTILYQKVNLKVPLIEKIVGIKHINYNLNLLEILKYGAFSGILLGILLVSATALCNPVLPIEFKELEKNVQPSLMVRFLYGGFTEEILMRFGLMTFITWLCSKIYNGTKPKIYWIAIVLAAIIFSVGHFPIVFQTLKNPPAELLIYIFIGNLIGGIVFGWLYWKKGLESAFIAHIFTHIILVLATPLTN